MSKYAINMADQLNKIRMSAHEKLRKESEVVVEVEKPSSLQTAAVDYLSKKEKPHPLGSPKNLNESVTEGKMSDLHMYIKQGKTAKEIGKLMGVDPKTIQKLMSAYDAKNESVELDETKKIEIVFEPRTIKNQMPKVVAFFKKNHPKFKLTQNMSDDSLTVDGGGKSLARIGKDIFNNYHIKKVVHEEVELDEAMDKKTAIEILKMKKKEDFVGRGGAMIYMSPDERDALKKKVGRLGRDVPGPSKGVSTMIIINNALGKDGTDGNRGDYDTEGKKMINMKKGGKSIGTPKTIGDAMKLAGIREEVEKTFSQKVKESVSNFNVESLLAEDNVDVLRSIVKNKAMKPIKLKDGAMKVDLFTASAIVQVLDKIKPANKIKLTKMLNGKKSDFMRASEGIMKMIGKR